MPQAEFIQPLLNFYAQSNESTRMELFIRVVHAVDLLFTHLSVIAEESKDVKQVMVAQETVLKFQSIMTPENKKKVN